MSFKEAIELARDKASSYTPVNYVIEDYVEDAELIQEEMLDHGRWAIVNRAVFKYDGKFYAVEYDTPATEYQDVDNSEYSVYEVTPVTKTIVDYVRVAE